MPMEGVVKLRQRVPDLQVAGTHHRYFSTEECDSLIEKINASRSLIPAHDLVDNYPICQHKD